MAKERFADYRDELHSQIEAWERKPGLRLVYEGWYARILKHLAEVGETVEIGSGSGNFKRFAPHITATDAIVTGPWIDHTVDARQLDFAENSLGNMVLIDCLHHLPRPLRFIRAAAKCLKPGGRLVLFEPAATLWARCVWAVCHHEPVDLKQDFVADDALPEPENPGFAYANMATAQSLFAKDWPKTQSGMGGLIRRHVEWSDVLAYPLTGGFSYRAYAPMLVIGSLRTVERMVPQSLLAALLALRVLVVLEKPVQV